MFSNEQVTIAIIKAATDITVAKINAKGYKFDNYTGHMNWFGNSLKEIVSAIEKQTKVKL